MAILSRNIAVRPEHTIKEIVEDRKVVHFDNCDLNIYETRSKATDFKLEFNSFVLTAMIQGKKIMHLPETQSFDYLPDEIVLVPSHNQMQIDFPEATSSNPTRCIALAIEDQLLQKTIELLNNKQPKVLTQEEWNVDQRKFHFAGSSDVLNTLSRLAMLGTEKDQISRSILSELTLKELIIRLMQSQAQIQLTDYLQHKKGGNKLSHVLQYIQENLTEKIDINRLSRLACMSKANFFKAFKKEFGLTPVDLIIKERIGLAKRHLLDPMVSVTDACYTAGFNNLSHFFRLFKKHEGVTPKIFKSKQF